jgi:hypothetical protein
MTQKVCVVGGGASGVALLWCIAKAKQHGLPGWDYDVTLIHEPTKGLAGVGGHSCVYTVTVNGNNYAIDLGVQMIAPKMYPNTMCMMNLPEFAAINLQPVELNISCTFPPDKGTTPYWGNFPAYQSTPLYLSGNADCATFESLMKAEPYLMAPLSAYLNANQSQFKDLAHFEDFFLDPYMSIMNGYGQALLGDVIVPEIAMIFNDQYASFTSSTSGFQRFEGGAVTLVQAMFDFAQAQLGSALHFVSPATVDSVYPSPAGGPVTVQWTPDTAPPVSDTFDAVVLAVDMSTSAQLLDNPHNNLWNFYSQFVGQGVWGLVPGYCYLHTDTSVLAPGMPDPLEETLQFTAAFAPAPNPTPYNLVNSFTTYIERNLMQVPKPDYDNFPYLLTMYGFDPTTYIGPPPAPPVPAASKTLWQSNWIHGMWLPSFMWAQKLVFHIAQSSSQHYPAYPSQKKTNIFFVGNNLTMDSEEGAIASALVLAKYAFGIPANDYVIGFFNFNAGQVLRATAFYHLFFNIMFPGLEGPASKLLSVVDLL